MEYFLLYSILKPLLDICQTLGLQVLELAFMLIFGWTIVSGKAETQAEIEQRELEEYQYQLDSKRFGWGRW